MRLNEEDRYIIGNWNEADLSKASYLVTRVKNETRENSFFKL